MPTIDALGPLLGKSDWIPHDGAIVALALLVLVDRGLRWEVDIFVDESPREGRTPIR